MAKIKEGAALDALAWTMLSEKAVIARLAAKLVRGLGEWDVPTQKRMTELLRTTSPPRGRAGPMLELLTVEFLRQREIFHKRRRAHFEQAAFVKQLKSRNFRINAAYASVFGKAVYLGRRVNPFPYQAPHQNRSEWEAKERARPKGDDCALLLIHRECIVAVLRSVDDKLIPQLKVRRFESGYTTTTNLRRGVDNAADLLLTLGGRVVLGALSHGWHVEVDYPGRKFIIHRGDGTTFNRPWFALRISKTDDDWRMDEQPITVMGRQETIEGEAGAREAEE